MQSSYAHRFKRASQLHVTAGCSRPAPVRLHPTLSDPAGPAHLASLPGSIPPLAVLHQHTTPQYTSPQVLLHHVRLLAPGRASCGTHGTSCALLPGRSVRTRRRSRTAPPQPLSPRTLFPPLGVLVFVCHHLMPRCHAAHPLPLAVSPPLLAPPRPLAFPLLLASPTPVLDHLLPLLTPRVFPSCSPPCLPSVRPPCILRVPGTHVLMRMCTAVLLLPSPTPRPRTTPPAATAPAASAPWAFSPAPGDSPGSPPGALLRASSSTSPPPFQAPFPLASPP